MKSLDNDSPPANGSATFTSSLSGHAVKDCVLIGSLRIELSHWLFQICCLDLTGGVQG